MLQEKKSMATSKLRILGHPKPPQTGTYSSKIVKGPVAEPNPKPAKKSERKRRTWKARHRVMNAKASGYGTFNLVRNEDISKMFLKC